MARLILLVLLLGAASTAHAVPVALIGGALAAAGASLAGVTSLAALQLAFSVGSLVFGTLDARRKQRKAERAQRDQYNAGLADRTVMALSLQAPWQVIYGQCQVGGSLEAILTSGDKDEFKHLVIVLAAHECDSIVDVLIGGVSVFPLNGDGEPTTGKWFRSNTKTFTDNVMFDTAGNGTVTRVDGQLLRVVIPPSGSLEAGNVEETFPDATLTGTTVSGGPISRMAKVTYTAVDGAPLVRVKMHLGDPDQLADDTLLAECPGQWSSTDRLRGLTYLVVRLNLNEPEFQGGPPAITAVVRGKPVYDHRTATTAWSNNPALCVADFLMAEYGKDARSNQIVWDTVDAAANACDEAVVMDGWSGLRYRCDGAFTTDQDADQVLEDLLASMAGWADGSGGWRIGAGTWTAPVATLTDDDNAGSVQIVGGEGLDELFNGVRGQFSDPSKYGVATDFTPYANAAFVTSDGQPLWVDMNMPYTNDPVRARNLARIAVESARGETLSFPAKIAVLNRMRVGDRVAVYCTPLGIAGATYRLQKRDEEPGGPVTLTLKQDSADMWDTLDAAEPEPGSYQNLTDPYAVPAPTGLQALSGAAYALVSGDSVIPRIYVSVTGAPQKLSDQLEVQWRESAATDWQRAVAPPDQRSYFIEGVSTGVTYFVRARWTRPSLGTYSDWRVTTCQAQGKTNPPPAFDLFTVTVLDNGVRRYAFGYTTTTQPVDWKGAEIRYKAGSDPAPDWDTMFQLNASGQVFPASPVDSNLPSAAGTYTFACRSRDGYGLSDPVILTQALGAGPAGLYVPDLTPPPTPTGFTTSAAIVNLFVEHDTPTYLVGHGHAKTRLYGVQYTGGPLPTFGDSALLAEFTGDVFAYPSSLGKTWRLWITWVSVDGVESSTPAGGTNGLAAATGVLDEVDLGDQIVTAAKLADGAVALAKFSSGITPIEVVGALPTTGNFAGRVVYLTTDGKLYRYAGGAWTSAVPTGDLSGQIASTQISDGAVSTPKLAAGAVTTGTLAAGAVTANEMAAGAVTAVKLAANAIAVGTAAIQAGAIVNVMIGSAAVDTAKIADLAVTNGKMANLSVTNGKIADLAVTTGKIADLAVDTIKIAGNAVTIPRSVASSTAVSLVGGSEVTLLTLPTFTSKGGQVVIVFGTMINSVSGVTGTWRVRRNGTEIFNSGVVPVPTSNFSMPPVTDVPGSGASVSYAITYQVGSTGGVITSQSTTRAAYALEAIK